MWTPFLLGQSCSFTFSELVDGRGPAATKSDKNHKQNKDPIQGSFVFLLPYYANIFSAALDQPF
jgi:hypothetical protein